MQVSHSPLLEMNHVLHSGSLGIFPGCSHHIRVNVIALDVHLHILIYHILCLLHSLIPQLSWYDIGPALSCKLPVHTWCYICCHHGCLYRKCTTAAKRIHKYSVCMPWCKHYERCCKCLSQRRLARCQTVSSLVKGISRCIKCHHHLILVQKNPYRILCSVLREPINVIRPLHSLNHSLFHDRLYIRW